MTSIAVPVQAYIVHILLTAVLIGIPLAIIAQNHSRKKLLDSIGIILLIPGIIVNYIAYMDFLQWCNSLEEPPLNVSCSNFLPDIIGSFVLGLIFAGLITTLAYSKWFEKNIKVKLKK